MTEDQWWMHCNRSGQTETITGIMVIEPPSWRNNPDLSRYHPNNGWVIPEFLEI